MSNQKEQESPMYELPVAYVVEFINDETDGVSPPTEQKLYSGYIHHFLSRTNPETEGFKIDGPLIATTIMKMPFENLEFCLYAMMNLLRSDGINYTLQDEKELIEKKLPLNLTRVTRADIIPGYEELIKSENNENNESN